MPDETVIMPRYEQIAIDIARGIVRNEYAIGDKLRGRSVLAGKYKVSPETIRRAIALLQNIGAVEAMAGSGITVKSREAAEEFIAKFERSRRIEEVQRKIVELMALRRKIDAEIEALTGELLNFASGEAKNLQHAEEIMVPEDSFLVGKTLGSAALRSETGATVVSIERGQEEFISPDSKMTIEAGDLLVAVGPPQAIEKLRDLVGKKV